jgi:hypothetical protein
MNAEVDEIGADFLRAHCHNASLTFQPPQRSDNPARPYSAF